MNAQIYLVSNLVNSKQYVGQTINPHLKRGHGRLLKKAYRYHGKENFTYEPIVTGITERNLLNYLERFWIATFGTVVPAGYNLESGGSEGIEWSDERRRKHGLALKGHRGWRKGLNLPSPNKGKTYPEEGKRKLSEALKGRPGPNKGKKLDDQWRANMSKAQKARGSEIAEMNRNRTITEETRQKMSEAGKRQVQSIEERMKRSESLKKWHAERKAQKNQMQLLAA